jgi:ribosomal protein L19
MITTTIMTSINVTPRDQTRRARLATLRGRSGPFLLFI